MNNDIDDPSDFELTELQTIDETLRCSICKELFKTAMILSNCSHTFCALCIRRSLSAEQFCPTCRREALESQLHNNYALDTIVSAWRSTRPTLLQFERKEQNTTATDSSPMAISEKSDQDTSPSSSQQRRSTRLGSRVETSSQPSASDSENPLVGCPNCNQSMKYSQMNHHLDRCLLTPGGGASTPSPLISLTTARDPPSPRKRNSFYSNNHPIDNRKPKKEVYGMYKDKDLRNLLKELGLPSHGDRKQMIRRHKEYVTLYQSNEDSLEPVDIPVLIRQLKRWEDSLVMAAKGTGTDTQEHHILFFYISLPTLTYCYLLLLFALTQDGDIYRSNIETTFNN